MPGLLGPGIGPGQAAKSKSSVHGDKKKKKSSPVEYDENGNKIDSSKQQLGKHVAQSGERVVYKSLLKKRTRQVDDDDEYDGTAKDAKSLTTRGPTRTEGGLIRYPEKSYKQVLQENYSEDPFGAYQQNENVVKKIDYDSLELLLYQNRISDYHDLVDKINLWAVNLGFLVKLRRPPKMNADGSKTMRVYCSSYKKADTDEKLNNGLVSKIDADDKKILGEGKDKGKYKEKALKDVKNPESDKCYHSGVCTFALTFKLEER